MWAVQLFTYSAYIKQKLCDAILTLLNKIKILHQSAQQRLE